MLKSGDPEEENLFGFRKFMVKPEYKRCAK
jgi:hypothetical protein